MDPPYYFIHEDETRKTGSTAVVYQRQRRHAATEDVRDPDPHLRVRPISSAASNFLGSEGYGRVTSISKVVTPMIWH
jgi:hypothetical protein